ncbi:ATP-binding protein [Vibrio sp. SCSIO 43136]|uniref:ATP-binding protein n=1 Tax=Vibrio sp. SCSIO 43136 TaxID=2819101 RepID=UPI00207582E7|nr:ATP-binding protein [Vibrio sp. SCSIO 43136]USD64173.1 GHKL domain-containing protein [Vibrio sp. SCSIO 43136]
MLNKPEFVRHLSLKNRLLIAASIWVGALILAAGLLIPNLTKNYLEQEMLNQLSLSMDEITANIDVNAKGQLILPYRLSDPRFNRPYSGLYWMASTDEQMLRSRSLWDQVIKFKRFRRAEGPNKEKLLTLTRQIYLPDFNQPVTLVVGVDEDPLEETLHKLTGQLWLILLVLFIGILVLIGVQVSWSLRPLNKMQKELQRLREGRREQFSHNYPKEIQPLITDLNSLLFHYQELLSRARNHAGNLSHALKTPISVLKNEVRELPESTQNKLNPPIQDLQRHIDYHLGRARMAGSMHILSVSSTPSDCVDALSLAFDKVYAHREILLINELDPGLHVSVEKADLDEMLGNLVENAYKWATSQIRLYQISKTKDSITLVIEDDGPGIEESLRNQAIKRGVRLDETTPGTGLGLNIVSEMAHSYRGKLSLEAANSGGLKVLLTLHLATS